MSRSIASPTAEQLRPLLVAVGLGGARRLAHARHLHVVGEVDLALLDRAFDRRRARRLGRAGERDVAFAGQQARGRIEADPARARQVDLAPGMEVGEIVRRAFGSFERLLVGHELDQVARGEARGEAEMAQDGDQQPAGVAARALGERRASPRSSARPAPGARCSRSPSAGAHSGRRGNRRCAACLRSTLASHADSNGPGGSTLRNGAISSASEGS